MTPRLLWTLLPHVVVLETWLVLVGVPGLAQIGPALLIVVLVALVGAIVLAGARIRRTAAVARRAVDRRPRRRPFGAACEAYPAVLLRSGNGPRGPGAGRVTVADTAG